MNRITVQITAILLSIAVTASELAGIALLADHAMQTVANGGNAEMPALVTAAGPDLDCGRVGRAAAALSR